MTEKKRKKIGKKKKKKPIVDSFPTRSHLFVNHRPDISGLKSVFGALKGHIRNRTRIRCTWTVVRGPLIRSGAPEPRKPIASFLETLIIIISQRKNTVRETRDKISIDNVLGANNGNSL
uniref:Uncharacterized protein n=1 Tax=Sipha flava TaxID=143950 RepID=A0A2S2R6W4_9HEMI